MMLLRAQVEPERAHGRSRSLGRPPRHGDEARGRGQRPGATIRHVHRGRSHQLRGAARRDLRPARPQRRRQDHDLPHAVRPAAGQRRHAARRRRRPARRAAPRRAQRIGYVAQKFSLYGQLSVAREPRILRQRLRPARRSASASASTGRCSSSSSAAQRELPSGQLPGGYKQRLAMAAALLHEPEILFLDEPTSGADPLARREFWRRITALAEQGVTVIVTTHFMEEAEYCDRVAILDRGRVLAQGTPAEIRAPRAGTRGGREPTMEDAFIAIVEEARASRQPAARRRGMKPHDGHAALASRRSCGGSARWCARRARQIVRDPSSIAIGIVLPVMLILLFGYGLSLDVKNVPVAVVLEDPRPTATELAAGFQLSPYFDAAADAPRCRRPQRADARAQGRRHRAHPRRTSPGTSAPGDAEVQILRARHRRQPRAHHPGLRAGRGRRLGGAPGGRGRADAAAARSTSQSRLWFNEANDSHYFLVPGLIVLVMTLIGALLTALVMAREWERGTLEALFVTPVRADEILLGKTIPYFVLGHDRPGAVHPRRQVPVPRAVPRLAAGAGRRVDALPAGGAGHRAADLVGGQEPVRRQPAHDAGRPSCRR